MVTPMMVVIEMVVVVLVVHMVIQVNVMVVAVMVHMVLHHVVVGGCCQQSHQCRPVIHAVTIIVVVHIRHRSFPYTHTANIQEKHISICYTQV